MTIQTPKPLRLRNTLIIATSIVVAALLIPSVAFAQFGGGRVGDGTAMIIESGRYTPTVNTSKLINVSSGSITTKSMRWTRIGNIVEVSGAIVFAPNSIGAITQVQISLPVASNLLLAADSLSGLGQGDSHVSYSNEDLVVTPEATDDEAIIRLYAGQTSSRAYFVTFTYEILD